MEWISEQETNREYVYKFSRAWHLFGREKHISTLILCHGQQAPMSTVNEPPQEIPMWRPQTRRLNAYPGGETTCKTSLWRRVASTNQRTTVTSLKVTDFFFKFNPPGPRISILHFYSKCTPGVELVQA